MQSHGMYKSCTYGVENFTLHKVCSSQQDIKCEVIYPLPTLFPSHPTPRWAMLVFGELAVIIQHCLGGREG